MENITINITGKNAERQASAIIRAFYKTMARMEDGGCHIQMSTAHSTENADDLLVPDFAQERRRRTAGRWG